MARRDTMKLTIARAVFTTPPVAWMLRSYARAKQRKLLVDRSYVRRHLEIVVRPDLISDALVDEACHRLADPRTAEHVERTSEVFASMLTPLNPGTERAVAHRRVVYGTDPMGRRMAQRMSGTVLPNANGSPMIEDPEAVAGILRELLV